jgi:hypothetical protein
MNFTTGTNSKGERYEGRIQVAIMLAIGSASGAASLHPRRACGRQPRPARLARLGRRRHVGAHVDRLRPGGAPPAPPRPPAAMPFCVLLAAVVLSLSAQILQAEQSPIGWVAAAIPALGFLAMAKMALGRTAAVETPANAPVSPGMVPVPAPSVAEVEALVDDERAIRYRQAAAGLRRTSKLPALNVG